VKNYSVVKDLPFVSCRRSIRKKKTAKKRRNIGRREATDDEGIAPKLQSRSIKGMSDFFPVKVKFFISSNRQSVTSKVENESNQIFQTRYKLYLTVFLFESAIGLK
ncbi:hypothetical protein L9F63_013924, partial [Diploptera punctata]